MHEYTDELPINEPDYYPPSSHTRVPPGVDSAEYIMSALRVSLAIAPKPALWYCEQHQGPSDQPTVNGLCPSCAASWQSGGRNV